MQNIKSRLAALFVLSFVVILSSCMKHDMDKMEEKNIDYPAAYIVNGENSAISIIRLSDNTVSETIQFPGGGGNMSNMSNMGDMIMWPHHIYNKGNIMAIGVPGMDLSAGHSGGMAGMKGKVILLDAIKGTIIKDIVTPVMNHNAVFSPDGSEIWTSQMDMVGRVLVYDAFNYTLKNTINVGNEPAEVTFSEDGTKAYVCNGMSNSVSVINPSTKAVISIINVDENPVGAWPAAGGKMFVDCEDGKTIAVIDVASNVKIATIQLGFKPGYAALNKTNGELWVSDATNGKIVYFKDLGSNSWIKQGEFATGADAHAIAFNGNFGYVTNQGANTVSLINLSTHTKVKDIAVGKKPNGIAFKL